MAIHDAYARRTPFELALPGDDFPEERFPAIAEEAEERGTDLSDPSAFLMLTAAGEALRELRGPDESPEQIQQHGALLWHAFHFWRSRWPVLLLSTHVARYLVEAGPESPRPELPGDAGYIQLPQHLFWVRQGSPDEHGVSTPESLDGFFWTAAGPGHVAFMACMGMRGDRPGLTVAPLPALSLDEVGAVTSAVVRQGTADSGEEDFSSDMAGAEMEGLYEIRTGGELVKLAGRALAFLAQHEPEDPVPAPAPAQTPAQAAAPAATHDEAVEITGPEGNGHGADPGPGPSALPFVRVTL